MANLNSSRPKNLSQGVGWRWRMSTWRQKSELFMGLKFILLSCQALFFSCFFSLRLCDAPRGGLGWCRQAESLWGQWDRDWGSSTWDKDGTTEDILGKILGDRSPSVLKTDWMEGSVMCSGNFGFQLFMCVIPIFPAHVENVDVELSKGTRQHFLFFHPSFWSCMVTQGFFVRSEGRRVGKEGQY